MCERAPSPERSCALELLEGEVVEMTPIGSQHAGAVNWLNRWFQASVGARAVVAVQNHLLLGEHCELQPDVALLAVSR